MGSRNRAFLTILGESYRASLRGSHARFLRAAADPSKVQATLLARFVGDHASTDRGQRLGFQHVSSIRGFQDRVPITGYEDYRQQIDRIAAGEKGVLSKEPVRVLEPTTGTTGGEKLIPYGPALLAEINAAIGPWLYSLYSARPSLRGTTSYWSLSPVARGERRSSGGIRIGLGDDTEYFGHLSRLALEQLMSVPSSVKDAHDVPTWRRQTLEHLLADRNLGLISVWSPTFLTLLMEALAADLDELLAALPPERADEILRGLDKVGAITGPAIWPRLGLVSCWTDGNAAAFVPALKRWFVGVEVQPKGLFATEGVVSFPLTPRSGPVLPGSILAVGSHFLEMIDLDHPRDRPRLVSELVPGGRYSPLITTASGFARYQLRDEVECVGRFLETPLVRFVGKLDRISDLCGEKLTSADVDRAVAAVRAEGLPLDFALLTPELGPPARYRLYTEGASELARVAASLDRALKAGFHYRYCRELGQLGPVEAVSVRSGWARYEAEMIRRGQRAGDIKPTQLATGTGWSSVYLQPDERAR